jgi:hypothetical protein
MRLSLVCFLASLVPNGDNAADAADGAAGAAAAARESHPQQRRRLRRTAETGTTAAVAEEQQQQQEEENDDAGEDLRSSSTLCTERADATFVNSFHNVRPCRWLYGRSAERRALECGGSWGGASASARAACPVACGRCPVIGTLHAVEGRDCSRERRCGPCQSDCDSGGYWL